MACFLLGFLYESGRGVVQDYKKAKECYQKAIKTGNEEVKNLA
ncbi:SEL1-like repeat protein [Helicobacter suis]